MLPGLAHLQQEIEHGHTGSDDLDLPQNLPKVERLIEGEAGQDVLDVDDADHVVEGFAIDRKPAVPLLGDAGDQVAGVDVDVEGHDVGSRHHGIDRGAVPQLENVGQQHPLTGVEGTFGAAVLLDQFLDGVAQGVVVAPPEDAAQPAGKLLGQRALIVALVVAADATTGNVGHGLSGPME